MRRLILFLFFLACVAADAMGAGPLFRHRDAIISQEFENVYRDIRSVRTIASEEPVAVSTTITGEIRMWPTTSAPTGWHICDGTAISRTTYADLFAVIGTTFGTGDGSTTFNLPDFRRRVPVGSGGTGTATLANSIGSTGGAETHTLTIAEMPSHDHDETARIGAAGGANIAVRADGSGDTVEDATYHTTSNTGGGGAHNNIQPSLVVNFIIKS